MIRYMYINHDQLPSPVIQSQFGHLPFLSICRSSVIANGCNGPMKMCSPSADRSASPPIFSEITLPWIQNGCRIASPAISFKDFVSSRSPLISRALPTSWTVFIKNYLRLYRCYRQLWKVTSLFDPSHDPKALQMNLESTSPAMPCAPSRCTC